MSGPTTLHVPHQRAPAGAQGPDAAVLQALRDGDERVFADFVRRTTPLLLTLARRVVADTAAAEDVVQDTWLVVLQRHQSFARRSSLRTWVVGTMLNIARRRRERDRLLVPVDDPATLGSAPTRSQVPGPELAVLEREFMQEVDRALMALPEVQRQVVHLRVVLDLDAAEVCRLLALSAGNQRVLLHRGRVQVRKGLHGYVDGQDVPA